MLLAQAVSQRQSLFPLFGRVFESNEVFSSQCGTIKRRQQERLCSSADERLVIEYYFGRGFRYDTIVHFLGEYLEIFMNVRTWHVDGYDKLKPYGLPIHGCVDGFSRRNMWLKVCKSNNDDQVIPAGFFLHVVEENGMRPMLVRTDCGTENGILAA